MSDDYDWVIVGGGLAGSIPARLLAAQGQRVLVIDRQEPYGASRASENLASAGWTSSPTAYSKGIAVLQANFALQEIMFTELPAPWGKGEARQRPMFFLPPPEILWQEPLRENVTRLGQGQVWTAEGGHYRGRVLLAAGVWSNELLAVLPPVEGYVGHGLIFPSERPPTIQLWAPYKHIKIFSKIPGHTYFGDSTSILARNYRETEHLAESLARARSRELDSPVLEISRGSRPSLKDYPEGLLWRPAEDLWVLTGGRRQGLVVYAMHAEELLRQAGVTEEVQV